MNEISEACGQPTLLIGLGGWGSRFADHVYGRVKENERVSAVSVDSNRDGMLLRHIPKENSISIGQEMTVQEYLQMKPQAKDWFPATPVVMYTSFVSGFMIRPMARMLWDMALEQGRFTPLTRELHRLAELCSAQGCPLRVSVLTTLVGGTGSGIFVQVAWLLREYLRLHFPGLQVKIQGEFILPSTFLALPQVRAERRNLECNAYAALKELTEINTRCARGEAPVAPEWGCEAGGAGVLPYDDCFLYDRTNFGHNISEQYIEDAVFTRLFSGASRELDRVFTEHRKLDENAENLYGTIFTEQLSANAEMLDFEVFRSAINANASAFENRIFLICAPRKLDIDKELLPRDTLFIEQIDPSAQKTTVTELCFGIRLSRLAKFRLNKGQYHLTYMRENSNGRMQGFMHLDKRWYKGFRDIGEELDIFADLTEQLDQVAKNRFVFISYSTADSVIAYQVRQVLEKNGIRCWMAPESIPAGGDYGQEIPQAIEGCSAFLLLLSEASQSSNWVPKELGLAIGKRKKVIPFQIDNAEITTAFNFYLTNSQRISAYNRMTEAYAELIRQLIKALTEESN